MHLMRKTWRQGHSSSPSTAQVLCDNIKSMQCSILHSEGAEFCVYPRAGGSGDDAPPPGFEHVQAGTHSLDSVTDRLADAEVRVRDGPICAAARALSRI